MRSIDIDIESATFGSRRNILTALVGNHMSSSCHTLSSSRRCQNLLELSNVAASPTVSKFADCSLLNCTRRRRALGHSTYRIFNMEYSEDGDFSIPQNANDEAETGRPIIDGLICRCHSLLAGLEVFQHRLRDIRKETNQVSGGFRNEIRSELAMLQNLAVKPRSDPIDRIALNGNLGFLENVWNEAKRAKSVSALRTRVYPGRITKSSSKGMQHIPLSGDAKVEKGSKSQGVLVDAITDDGRTWTKTSLVTNRRLLFEVSWRMKLLLRGPC